MRRISKTGGLEKPRIRNCAVRPVRHGKPGRSSLRTRLRPGRPSPALASFACHAVASREGGSFTRPVQGTCPPRRFVDRGPFQSSKFAAAMMYSPPYEARPSFPSADPLPVAPRLIRRGHDPISSRSRDVRKGSRRTKAGMGRVQKHY